LNHQLTGFRNARIIDETMQKMGIGDLVLAAREEDPQPLLRFVFSPSPERTLGQNGRWVFPTTCTHFAFD
jgi:hypothetical protein